MYPVLAQHFPGEEWVPVGFALFGAGVVFGVLGCVCALVRRAAPGAVALGFAAVLLGIAAFWPALHERGYDLGSLVRTILGLPAVLLIPGIPMGLGLLAVALGLSRRREPPDTT